MGMRLDPVGGELGELLAHHVHGFVEPCVLHSMARQRVRQQRSRSRKHGLRLSLVNQLADDCRCPQSVGGVLTAKLVRPDGLTLVHRDAADHLSAILAEQDLGEQRLGLTELAFRFQPGRPFGDLAEGFHISDKPGEPVGKVLAALEGAPIGFAVRARQQAPCPGNRGSSVGVERGNGFGQHAHKPGKHRALALFQRLYCTHRVSPCICGCLMSPNRIEQQALSGTALLCGATSRPRQALDLQLSSLR